MTKNLFKDKKQNKNFKNSLLEAFAGRTEGGCGP